MDTKQLLDLAYENDINTRDPEGYQDIQSYVVDWYMANPAELILDNVADWIGNIDYKPEEAGDGLAGFLNDVASSYETNGRLQRMGKQSYHGGESFSVNAAGLSLRLAHIGGYMLQIITENVEKHVEDHIEGWWDEMGAYQYDMDEAGKADYYEGVAEDRRLNGDD